MDVKDGKPRYGSIKVIVIIPVGLEAKHGDLRFCIKLSLFEEQKYFDLSKILANIL